MTGTPRKQITDQGVSLEKIEIRTSGNSVFLETNSMYLPLA